MTVAEEKARKAEAARVADAQFEQQQRDMRARAVLEITKPKAMPAAKAMRQMKAAPALLAALKQLRAVNMASVARNRSAALKAAITKADAAIAEAEAE
jgi:hypothetical protein